MGFLGGCSFLQDRGDTQGTAPEGSWQWSRGNTHPEGPPHFRQWEPPWGAGAKGPSWRWSWEQDEGSLLVMEPLGSRMKGVSGNPMSQGGHGSRMRGVCGVQMGQVSWWWFGGHASYTIPRGRSHSIPSYPILDLVPNASPMEVGPNPSRPWPWGPAPQHLGTPTLSLGSACLASRSSSFHTSPQVSTAGSPKLALPAWHPSGTLHAGGGCGIQGGSLEEGWVSGHGEGEGDTWGAAALSPGFGGVLSLRSP